jgi:hypothetical protein
LAHSPTRVRPRGKVSTEHGGDVGSRAPDGEERDSNAELRAGAGRSTCMQASVCLVVCARRGERQNLGLDRLGGASHDDEGTRAAKRAGRRGWSERSRRADVLDRVRARVGLGFH